ncbi:condensation domain-containing protein [Streptosporangium soli]|nr:condensation domain-containing protein [Streptosporangium sp. KLBMP 9127]
MSVSEVPSLRSDLDRVPLSWNLAFLRGFDKGDEEGPFGPRYTIVCGWRLSGPLDAALLQEALDDVVVRHEALRTEIVREDGGGGHQRVVPPSPALLTVRDLSAVPGDDRDRSAEELLNEVEAEPFPLSELPLVRAVVGRFDERDAVLVLIAHHIGADEWSMRLIMRDLAHAYAVRAGHDVPAPPKARQYRQYVEWEQTALTSPVTARSQEYWRNTLAGARVLGIKTDHPRSEGLPKATAWQRFRLPADLTLAVQRIGKETRSSPFMVLLAAYAVYLGQRAKTTDIVIPTFSSGRGDARFHDTVGSFFNFMPLRIDAAECGTFRDVVTRTRGTCVSAYAHDLPFAQVLGEAPELMLPAMEDDIALVVFQVFRSPLAGEPETAGDLNYSVIRRSLLSQPVGGDVPDGAMWHLEIDNTGELVGSMAFNSNLFDEETISDMVAGFSRTLRLVITDPDAPLEIV